MNDIIKSIYKRKEFESKLIVKAVEDKKFRDLLINDAKKAIEEVLGKSFPDEVEVHVVEETTNSITISIPPELKTALNAAEQSDEVLENINGGISVGFVAAAVTTMGAPFYGITDSKGGDGK